MKIVKNILMGISILVLIWALVSWREVVSMNCSPNPEYNQYNLFEIFEERA